MSEILEKLTVNTTDKKVGLDLRAVAALLQPCTEHVLYILSDNLHNAGTYDDAYKTFCKDGQEYILLSSIISPYQSWTIERKPSSLQRYCLNKLYTFFNKVFVYALLNEDNKDVDKVHA